MLKFREYLEEASTYALDADDRHITQVASELNAYLDKLTEKSYQNAPIFLNQLRGAMEKYGVLLGSDVTPAFLNLNAELVFSLGTTNLHLYVIYDTTDEGYVDGYAQIVTPDELQELLGMQLEEYINKPLQKQPRGLAAKYDADASDAADYDPPFPGSDGPRVEPNLPAEIPNPLPE